MIAMLIFSSACNLLLLLDLSIPFEIKPNDFLHTFSPAQRINKFDFLNKINFPLILIMCALALF